MRKGQQSWWVMGLFRPLEVNPFEDEYQLQIGEPYWMPEVSLGR